MPKKLVCWHAQTHKTTQRRHMRRQILIVFSTAWQDLGTSKMRPDVIRMSEEHRYKTHTPPHNHKPLHLGLLCAIQLQNGFRTNVQTWQTLLLCQLICLLLNCPQNALCAPLDINWILFHELGTLGKKSTWHDADRKTPVCNLAAVLTRCTADAPATNHNSGCCSAYVGRC